MLLENLTEQKKVIKVLFYTNLPRFFRPILIGYLYEIAQVYPVVLLSEILDKETEELIKDKVLFPKLEEIVPVHQYTGEKMNVLKRHRYFLDKAKNIIQSYKPDIVVVTGNNFFETYLRRFAKEINAINIWLARPILATKKEVRDEYIVKSAYLKAPSFLPYWIRALFAKSRMYLGHFLYYWILPLLMRQRPFMKQPSCLFMEDYTRYGGIDYFIVSSPKAYNILREEGVPVEKVFMLLHPLARTNQTRRALEKVYFGGRNTPLLVRGMEAAKRTRPKGYPGLQAGVVHFVSSLNKTIDDKKILTVMWPPEPIGIKRDGNYSLISKEDLLKERIKIISEITKALKNWKIFIKAHPLTENVEEIIKILQPISDQIVMTESADPVDKYIYLSDVIVGLSPASTALYDALIRRPEIPILSLDFQHELFGDFYKDFNGIDYIDNEKKFISVLESIRDASYCKQHGDKVQREAGLPRVKEFSSAVEMLDYLLSLKTEKTSKIS